MYRCCMVMVSFLRYVGVFSLAMIDTPSNTSWVVSVRYQRLPFPSYVFMNTCTYYVTRVRFCPFFRVLPPPQLFQAPINPSICEFLLPQHFPIQREYEMEHSNAKIHSTYLLYLLINTFRANTLAAKYFYVE